MSHIYPLEGQRHFHLSKELTTLGGVTNDTFRLAYAWDGEHYFEIPDDTTGDDLFNKWIEYHGGDPIPAPDVQPAEPESTESSEVAGSESPADEADPTFAAVAEATTTAPADPAPAATETATDTDPESPDTTTTEPPAESTQDDAAAVEEPASDDPKPRASTRDTSKKAGSTTSGTTRKRSAKNSNRRS